MTSYLVYSTAAWSCNYVCDIIDVRPALSRLDGLLPIGSRAEGSPARYAY